MGEDDPSRGRSGYRNGTRGEGGCEGAGRDTASPRRPAAGITGQRQVAEDEDGAEKRSDGDWQKGMKEDFGNVLDLEVEDT